MPVLITSTAESTPGFTAPDMINPSNSYPEHGRNQNYWEDIWPRPEISGIPITNFACPLPANVRVYWDSHEQTELHRLSQTHSTTIRGGPTAGTVSGTGRRTPRSSLSTGRHGQAPGFQGKHEEGSHASSEETLLYPEDLADVHVPFAGYEDSEGAVTGGAELEKVYQEYLAEGAENTLGDTGVTIMLQDIPYRMQVEPHVMDLLQSTSELNHVDYIYLPMTIAMKRSTEHGLDGARNKGYCFIHFSNSASAERFISRLEHYVLPASVWTPSKTMKAGLAKFQGLSLNLRSLLDIQSKKWRPKNGHVYIRRAGGKLAPYGLLRLRSILKQRCRSTHRR
jgi:hypothetical protein